MTSLYILFHCALGGVLSPLLSNVVLNDLDHWIASQWLEFPTRYKYCARDVKIRQLRTGSSLKEIYIVRYADDFKLFTKTMQDAQKIFQAVKGYLKSHLKLDISPEKSRITNLRKRKSEFLGFELKAIKHKQGYKVKSNISKRNKIKIKERVRELIKSIQKSPSHQAVSKYNAYVLGIHNYYRIATLTHLDFKSIAYSLKAMRYNRLRRIATYEVPRSPPLSYSKYYKNNYRTFKIGETYLYPLEDINHKGTYNFNQRQSNYTSEGRANLTKLQPEISQQIQYLMTSRKRYRSVEYLDNRLSRYSMQNGKCAVTGYFLESDEIHSHHIIPVKLGGTDKFNNLVILHKWIHQLIHAVEEQAIQTHMSYLKLGEKELKKINAYREACKLNNIYF